MRVGYLCAIATLAACAAPAVSVQAATPAPAGDACGSAAAKAGDFERVVAGGREYRLHVPPRYDGKSRLPLVVGLHGGFGTGAKFEEISGFDALADREGFMVAYPDGIGRAWNAGDCCGKPSEKGIDDVGFIAAMVEQIGADYCVDRTRVYATGFSNGAGLTLRLACERPELFAALAPVSGRINVPQCPAKTPVPVLYLQGRQDERNPWGGGEFDGRPRASVKDLVATLAKNNGCSAEEESLPAQGRATCARRAKCSGAPVTYCGIDQTGHQWPGGKAVLKRLLGPNDGQYDATARIWEFFAAHHR